jgi:hypothetical protein
VAGEADVGGRIGVRVVTGREPVAAGLLQFFGPKSSTTLLALPAGRQSRVVALRGGRVVTLATLTISGGRVVHIDALADAERLAPLSAALGV